MARRNGKPGSHLVIDQYTGFTTYRERIKRDFWGAYAKRPLKRNLQDIATPLLDPYPVDVYTGSAYEQIPNTCVFETLPLYIGTTNIRTPTTGDAAQAFLNIPAIPDQEVGCTNVVMP